MKRTALLRVITASNGNSLLTFRYNLSVPTSRAIRPMGLIGCPDTSVRNYHHSLRNNPGGRNSHLLRDGSLKSPTMCNKHFPFFFIVFSLLTGNDAMNEIKCANQDEQRCNCLSLAVHFSHLATLHFPLWLQLLWLRLLQHTIMLSIWYSR
jgi:hypothetical protein